MAVGKQPIQEIGETVAILEKEPYLTIIKNQNQKNLMEKIYILYTHLG